MRIWTWVGRLEGGMASVGAGLCLLAMMLMTVVSVFGRYLLGADLIPGGYNIIERLLFPLLVFWALPLAHRAGTFPRLEMIQDALPARAYAGVTAFVLAVEVVVFGLLLWYVSSFAWQGYVSGRQMQVGTAYWPLYPVLAMVPLSFGLMFIEMVRLVVADVRKAL
jgi:TRAP-type C4-dicarboxylate transport system permease small subunit